jgi:hypothetical protein
MPVQPGTPLVLTCVPAAFPDRAESLSLSWRPLRELRTFSLPWKNINPVSRSLTVSIGYLAGIMSPDIAQHGPARLADGSRKWLPFLLSSDHDRTTWLA